MIAIVYATIDGQSQKVAEFIKEEVGVTGEVVELVSIETIDERLLNMANKIIVIASIRYGKFSKKVYRFVEDYRPALTEKKADFIGINLIARSPEKQQIATNVYVRKFLEKVTWQPVNVEIVAGALRYTKYKWFDKTMIKLIMKLTDGPTDTSVDTEFTDWSQISDYVQSKIIS
ncbi:menaquinone-dependent protoporphyrinogen IX dehydrogenase [Vagococcus intermedius]|uniref:Protoporphyrinogen IX dehydrogenase [quinone] n=1 Tax=Vagococcus intermedius TaxID=2991418 RepID=A0AAF0CV85_9ENTE|nr:menaquinone-dependent protoporphyrinogen IX dehydrogenase [Vagococcus intermedius]WEG73630.1 menaquinone-dependent protoporphyrinogen IX dehydrogenase [Vagococcus intermedius]WEG75714.1 menaquinone-dependent protoporphyrinogen IX dehydrogenase [Vagococcus intermedius]